MKQRRKKCQRLTVVKSDNLSSKKTGKSHGPSPLASSRHCSPLGAVHIDTYPIGGECAIIEVLPNVAKALRREVNARRLNLDHDLAESTPKLVAAQPQTCNCLRGLRTSCVKSMVVAQVFNEVCLVVE